MNTKVEIEKIVNFNVKLNEEDAKTLLILLGFDITVPEFLKEKYFVTYETAEKIKSLMTTLFNEFDVALSS